MVVTLDLGPRIIRFGFCGGKNIFYEQQDFDKNQPTDEPFTSFGDKGVWHIYGGHRLWTSPESLPRTYYPDNRAVTYKKEGDRLVFIQEPQSWTNIELSIEVKLTQDGAELIHKIKNIGAWNTEIAPWALSVMAKGGTLIVRRPEGGEELLPNMFMALWPYCALNDERFSMGEKYIFLKQENIDRKFKFGVSGIGHAAYINDGTMFIKSFDVNKNGNYPDGGMSFEGFTNANMLEVESLGELVKIPPEGVITHVERWKLVKDVDFDGTEEKADKLFRKYVL